MPSLGNNDVSRVVLTSPPSSAHTVSIQIWPHNILYPGPNGIINEFLECVCACIAAVVPCYALDSIVHPPLSIWHKWIPSEQQHVFQRGTCFSVPLAAAVLTL